MNGGRLIVELDSTLSERVAAAAEAAGKPVLDYAVSLITDSLHDGWAEDDARFAEYERTGVSASAEEALIRMRESLRARFQSGI